MKLVVGLGNPGKEYENTRHYIGFIALESLVSAVESFGEWHDSKKLGAMIAKGTIGNEPVMVVKPIEFYNNSGPVLQRIMAYYKASIDDLIIIHDDVDLSIGKVKITKNSSAAGNNGVQSIIDTLKSQEFRRIRIGVVSEKNSEKEAMDIVLQKFTTPEKKLLKSILEQIPEIIKELIIKFPAVETAQNKFHGNK